MTTAWDLIGWDDGRVMIRGGKVTYDSVSYDDSRQNRNVKLERLEAVSIAGRPRLRVVTRYVRPDTELVPADEMAEENWPT